MQNVLSKGILRQKGKTECLWKFLEKKVEECEASWMQYLRAQMCLSNTILEGVTDILIWRFRLVFFIITSLQRGMLNYGVFLMLKVFPEHFIEWFEYVVILLCNLRRCPSIESLLGGYRTWHLKGCIFYWYNSLQQWYNAQCHNISFLILGVVLITLSKLFFSHLPR